MSLISDALKRQEQLRAASGTGAAQREVAAAAPPEVAATGSPEVAAAMPPEVAVAAPPETSPPQGAQLRRASGATSRGVAAQNPFLARERAAARRPNHSILLMPILGLIVLLVLLFLRREFVPRESTETNAPYSPRKVEESAPAPIVLLRDDPSREEGTGNREEGTDGPSADGRDEARPSQAVDQGVEPSDGASIQAQREADEPSALRQEASPPTSPPLGGATTAAQAAPTSRGDAAPNLAAPAAQPQPPVWPSFTLTGIAVGRERLAILNTGEMLLAGETSKCGVKVEKVDVATVVFAWGGETKTLRKGEHSDKPAD